MLIDIEDAFDATSHRLGVLGILHRLDRSTQVDHAPLGIGLEDHISRQGILAQLSHDGVRNIGVARYGLTVRGGEIIHRGGIEATHYFQLASLRPVDLDNGIGRREVRHRFSRRHLGVRGPDISREVRIERQTVLLFVFLVGGVGSLISDGIRVLVGEIAVFVRGHLGLFAGIIVVQHFDRVVDGQPCRIGNSPGDIECSKVVSRRIHLARKVENLISNGGRQFDSRGFEGLVELLKLLLVPASHRRRSPNASRGSSAAECIAGEYHSHAANHHATLRWAILSGRQRVDQRNRRPDGQLNSRVPTTLPSRQVPPGRAATMPRPTLRYRYGITELEEETGVSARTIRYYVGQGLLAPAYGRGPSATYDLGHLLRLRLIQHLKEEGYSLNQIKELISRLTDEEIERMLGVESRPPEDIWRRIWIGDEIELHVKQRLDDEHNEAWTEAVEDIAAYARSVLDHLGSLK